MARIVLDTGSVDGTADGSLLGRALRDAGHEVVLLAGTDAAAVAAVAVQEDADLVLSYGGPSTRRAEVRAALADRGAADVPAHVADPADPASAVARAASYDR